MTPFIHTQHCRSRAHCKICLQNKKWRVSVGAPDICPYGVSITPDSVLEIPAPVAVFPEFFNLNAPCPKGYEDLRAAYLKDVEAAGGDSCSDCTLSSINAKYVAKIRCMLKNKPHES